MDRIAARNQGLQLVANAIGYRIVAKASADGQSDSVENHAGDDDQDPGRIPVRRMHPFGILGVPPEKSPGCVVFVNGDVNQGILLATGNDRYQPSGLVEGEVAFYSKASGCVQKFDKNGKISIAAASAEQVTVDAGTGADVVVNGGTLLVARKTDTVDVGTLSVALHTVSGVPTTFVFYTPQGSTPACSFPANASPVPTAPTVLWFASTVIVPAIAVDTLVNQALTGEITSGAAHFKG